MEGEAARLRSLKSVVHVRDDTDPDAYCTGCVIVKSKVIPGTRNRTIILTSSRFVRGRENSLTVLFWSSREFRAAVYSTHEQFTLLSINLYRGCEAIDLVEDNAILNSRCFMRVPIDNDTTNLVFTYATCDSIESYALNRPRQLVPNSSGYFTVSCSYRGKTADGLNRLTGSPVFCAVGAGTVGKVRGIILQDCRHETKCSGREFKVALTATYVRQVIMALDPTYQ